jgi:hypothetical protein
MPEDSSWCRSSFEFPITYTVTRNPTDRRNQISPSFDVIRMKMRTLNMNPYLHDTVHLQMTLLRK